MNFTYEEEDIDDNEYKKKRWNNYNKKKELKINISKNEDEIIELYRNNYEFNENNCDIYGIIFTSPTEYSIRFSYYYSLEMYETLIQKRKASYISSEYLYDIPIIQTLVDRALIKTYSDPSIYQEYNITKKYMDRVEYSETYNDEGMLDYVSLFMLFYFVPCICSLLNQLVIEKESKIKQSLVIIGLKRSSFWISWAITYGTIIIISSFIATFIIHLTEIYIFIDWSILVTSLLIFGMTCCCISFIFSTFIEKAKTANTVGVMLIILIFVMYFIYKAIDKVPKIKLFCIYTLSPISFLSLFKYLISLEKQGLNTNLINVLRNNNLRNCFFGLCFTLILYFFIAVYLDNILPQGNNFHKKWHFLVTDFFLKKKRNIKENCFDSIKNPFIEKDPEGLKKAVEVKNIRKDFIVKGEIIEVLKNISFNGYYNEIFCILGHNGAGKTTLMNIMTGILSSTQGEIYYDNVPINGNETEICKQIGYCPQFDTFNNNLTIGEHVKLFAGIKNVSVNIQEVLRSIDLLEKINNFPKELSGGQRRKLCITLALLGSPKFIFLDEPTTGLDPYSRKKIWELLSKNKKNCIMFITTHYMDEADLLADRKMIISNGNITCLGTSLFLKNSFNMNYSLDIHAKEPSDCNITDSIIGKYFSDAVKSKIISLTNTYVHEIEDINNNNINNNDNNPSIPNNNLKEDCIITYQLPMKLSMNFKDIFCELNKIINNNDNGVMNFSLTAPTLEELFVRLENNSLNPEIQSVKGTAVINMNTINNNDNKDSNKNDDNSNSYNNNISKGDNESNEFIEKLNPIFGKKSNYQSSNATQIYSIFKLRIKIFLRNKTFAIVYTLLPICLIIICIYFENKIIESLNTVTLRDPLKISPDLYNNDILWFKDTNSNGNALDIINKIDKNSGISLKSVDYNKELTVASGKLTPNMKYIGGFRGYEDDQHTLQFTLYRNITYYFSLNIAINMLHNALLEYYNSDKIISVTYNPFPISNSEVKFDEDDEEELFNIGPEETKQVVEPILIVTIAIAISLSVSIYGPLTVKEREDGINHQLLLNGTKRVNYWLGILLSDFICLIVPIFLIEIAGMINDVGIYNKNIIIYTIFASIIWALSSILHQYCISSFFKKYETVSSIFIIINPILCLTIGIYFMVNIDNDKENQNPKLELVKSCILMFLYAPASIVIIYTKLSIFIIKCKLNITPDDIKTFIKTEVAQGILNDKSLNGKEKSDQISKAFFNDKMPSLGDIYNTNYKFFTLLLTAMLLIGIYGYILYFLEKKKIKGLKENNDYNEEDRRMLDKKLENGPQDVLNEWKKVKAAMENNNSSKDKIILKVFQLNKDFPMSYGDMMRLEEEEDKSNENNPNSNNANHSLKGEKTAFERMDNRIVYDENAKKKRYVNRIVDDVTFGISEGGECLGLLGPNGAGKTTSISMITGLLSHTHGKIVYGHNDLNETEMADLSLGYCAQQDALWSLLTVKETLNFYLSICGYPSKEIPEYVKLMIEACGIENHTNKKVNEISGGTKRKLSLLIAISSSPNYLILDEPSAGMDPFTRRYMWSLITNLKKVRKTATILTTHSTEEAEALCERIAILIKGRLVCIDTPRSIKMSHSNQYILEVFTDQPEQFEQDYVIKNNLFGLGIDDEKYELESAMTYQKYTVKMKVQSIAKVFEMMETAKENGIISQYNFGQYSLEQVFINFVNNSE